MYNRDVHIGHVIAEDAADALLELPKEPPESPPGSPYFRPLYGIDEVHEHNTFLQAPADRFDLFETMERTCAAVHAAASHRRGLVASAKLAVTDGAYADELRRSIGVVDDSVRGLPSEGAAETLADMVGAQLNGIYIGAPVWEQAGDGLHYPDRVEAYSPRTLEGASYSEGGRLVGFIQTVQSGRSRVSAFLPISQIVYCTDRSGTGPFGQGLKRVMYPDYRDIVEVQRQLRGGVRKAAFSAIQIRYDVSQLPPNVQKRLAKKFDGAEGERKWAAEQASVLATVSRVEAHKRSSFSLPEGWYVESFGTPLDPAGLLSIERSRHRRILEAAGAGHMNTGAEGTGGTYNAARELQRVSEVISATGVKRLIAAYNRGVVDPWYQYNYPAVAIEDRAYLTFSGLDAAQLAGLVEVVERIGDRLGLDDEDVSLIRERSGFRPLSDDMRGIVRSSAQAGAALSGIRRPDASQLATLRQKDAPNG